MEFDGFQHTLKYKAAVVTSRKSFCERIKFKMTSVKKVLKFNWKKNEFAFWSAKAKSYLAKKFLGPTLLASFKDSLQANEQVELDLNKPDELAKNKRKAMSQANQPYLRSQA
jgi:hypothetical protein